MESDRAWKGKEYPAPGAWLDDDSPRTEEPPREQSKLLELLGLINLRILSGHNLYIEVGGAVYKILYGCYWRSVFTGAEHYFLRCDRVADGVWIEGHVAPSKVDLAIRYTDAGWLVKGHSLKFMLYGD
ncbi:MAG TPA: hypothetical protein VJT74_13485 [Pyrinomonadaceae bacterium]|nr:hypothetical protein [Pyrinomonadaceae bacterium]